MFFRQIEVRLTANAINRKTDFPRLANRNEIVLPHLYLPSVSGRRCR